MAFLCRKRRGLFEVSRDDASAFLVTTDVGNLRIDRTRRRLVVERREVSFGDIQRLDYRWNMRRGTGEEWVLTDIGPWDLLGRYEDRVHWYEIAALMTSGERIPLYITGQYEPREPLMAWWFEWQLRVFARMGLYVDAEEHAREKLDVLLRVFRESGRELRLVGAPSDARPPLPAR